MNRRVPPFPYFLSRLVTVEHEKAPSNLGKDYYPVEYLQEDGPPSYGARTPAL